MHSAAGHRFNGATGFVDNVTADGTYVIKLNPKDDWPNGCTFSCQRKNLRPLNAEDTFKQTLVTSKSALPSEEAVRRLLDELTRGKVPPPPKQDHRGRQPARQEGRGVWVFV